MPIIYRNIFVFLVIFSSFARAETIGKVIVDRDVVYDDQHGQRLTLNIAHPIKSDKLLPLVICIHGGAWRMGDKERFDGTIVKLAEQDYIAATIDYRFAPKFKYPAQVEDVQAAIRFLRSKSKELNIDPSRVAALGESAGGYLALMVGLMDRTDIINPDEAKFSSKVQVVINFFGPTDFTATNWTADQFAVAADFLGTKNPADLIVKKASPISYVNKGDATVFTFHGTDDTAVPIDQAQRLHQALKRANVPETLVIVPHAGHGFTGDIGHKTELQSFQFLNAALKTEMPQR